jgi:hypothetical protein
VLLVSSVVALTIALLPVPVGAAHPFQTGVPAYITLTGSGQLIPIITVGDDSYHDVTFQGIPDGIGVRPGPTSDTVDVFVNHEETTVPFFDEADFQDASVTKWTLSTASGTEGEVVGAEVAIPSSDGFLRFCSASMAGPAEGFSTYTFFTGEETNDIVPVSPGAPDADSGSPGMRQGGFAVVLNTDTGESTAVPGMGRLNHENTIAVPGYNQLVMLTTDDTFSGPSAQLYMYLANQESHVWQDKGSLWAFQVTSDNGTHVNQTDPFNGANDYLDLAPGDEFSGKFIRVPKQIARGTQDALEDWSNDHNVFQFIRLEDLAYDKNDPNVIYIADTGRTRVVPDDETGRMMRGPGGTVGQADNGSIFKMVLNSNNPKKVDSLTVLAQGDDDSLDAFVAMRNPDNVDTSVNSLMVQEDTSDAKIWQHELGTTNWNHVATANETPWETSGIVDVSDWYGSGWWLLDVQGHGDDFWIDSDFDAVTGVTSKLEAGQLLLMEIPGS